MPFAAALGLPKPSMSMEFDHKPSLSMQLKDLRSLSEVVVTEARTTRKACVECTWRFGLDTNAVHTFSFRFLFLPFTIFSSSVFAHLYIRSQFFFMIVLTPLAFALLYCMFFHH